jgi:dTDP-4-amino-4,6-dideoxygalactose transaminase
VRSIGGIEMPFPGRTGVAHLAVVVVEDDSERDPLREALATCGIQSSLHYPPIHLFDHYRSAFGHRRGDLPVAEALAARMISLPLYPTMTSQDVDDVCDCIESFMGSRAAGGTVGGARRSRGPGIQLRP